MRKTKSLAVLFSAIWLTACGSRENPSLLFMQVDSLGVGGSAGIGNQGGDLVVGYRGLNMASVPVAVTRDNGETIRVGGHRTRADGRDDGAFSVFGHFGAGVGAATNAAGNNVEIGKFFATGFAARKLSEGYRNKLSK